MGTKDKILQKSLDLFNKYGTDAVTVRQIAAEIGMSHGNLCYHFASTDALIEALYLRLVGEMDAVILMPHPENIGRGDLLGDAEALARLDLSTMYQTTLKTYTLLYQYRFLMLDFVHIMRRIEFVRTHYQQLSLVRRGQFTFLLNQLKINGLVRADLSEQETNDWISLATLFGDFWLSNAAILYDGNEEDKVRYYADLFMRLGKLYFTERGLNELKVVVS